jgi:hypothetical protein
MRIMCECVCVCVCGGGGGVGSPAPVVSCTCVAGGCGTLVSNFTPGVCRYTPYVCVSHQPRSQ